MAFKAQKKIEGRAETGSLNESADARFRGAEIVTETVILTGAVQRAGVATDMIRAVIESHDWEDIVLEFHGPRANALRQGALMRRIEEMRAAQPEDGRPSDIMVDLIVTGFWKTRQHRDRHGKWHETRHFVVARWSWFDDDGKTLIEGALPRAV